MDERMDVVRVVESNGSSHIEPPLGERWSDSRKLQWHAAVVRHDTGIDFNVVEAHVTVRGRRVHNLYAIAYRSRHGSGHLGAYNFESMWDFINGIDLGARLAQAVPCTAK